MKKFIVAMLIVVAVPFIAALVLLMVVDPNDYKPQISEAVEETTGQELIIDGDIEWRLFPSFGLNVSDVTLSNPEGFSEPHMASLKELSVAIAVAPLFERKLEVEGVTLSQVRLNIITLADGRNNLESLTEPKASDAPKESKQSASEPKPEVTVRVEPDSRSGPGLKSVTLGKITIQDIQVLIDNQQSQSQQKLALELFELSQFAPGKKSDAKLLVHLDAGEVKAELAFNSSMTLSEAFDVIELHQFELQALMQGESLPNGELKKSIQGLGVINLKETQVDLTDIQIEVASLTGTGWFKFRQAKVPELDFALNFDTFNLADFLPPTNEESEAEEQEPVATTDPDAEPDLTALNGFNLDGLVTFEQVIAQGVQVQDVHLKMTLQDGIFKTAPLKALLYDGEFVTQATLNAQKEIASYQADVQLKGVQVLPLLKDAADLKLLSGAANFDLALRGTGLSTNKLKLASKGQGNFLLADGAVYGVNIPHKIRTIKASLSGDKAEKDEKKTDFTELSGSFTLADGNVNNPDLMLASPLLRVSGEGDFDVVKTYVDYRATTELVATSKGQGGKSADDLSGLRIPLRIKGTPDDLSYKLDTDAALKEETKRKAKEKEKELKQKAKEKLKDKIGNLFG